jgi:hypothetical protein
MDPSVIFFMLAFAIDFLFFDTSCLRPDFGYLEMFFLLHVASLSWIWFFEGFIVMSCRECLHLGICMAVEYYVIFFLLLNLSQHHLFFFNPKVNMYYRSKGGLVQIHWAYPSRSINLKKKISQCGRESLLSVLN